MGVAEATTTRLKDGGVRKVTTMDTGDTIAAQDAASALGTTTHSVDSDNTGNERDAAVDRAQQYEIRHTAWKGRSNLLHQLRDKLRQSWETTYSAREGMPENALVIADVEDYKNLIQEIIKQSPEYSQDAQMLLHELVTDDMHSPPDLVKEAAADLGYVLELCLLRRGTANVRQLKRKIKNYVFFIRARCLRRLSTSQLQASRTTRMQAALDDEPLLSPEGQSELIRCALAELPCSAVPPTSAAKPVSNLQPDVIALSATIDAMQGTPGVTQVATKKRHRPLKDQLKKTRQRVNWTENTLQYVVFEDILQGMENTTDRQTRAQQIWETECFSLDMFTVDAHTMTQAETFGRWLSAGYDRSACESYWEQGSHTKRLDVTNNAAQEWMKDRLVKMKTTSV